MLVVQSLPFIAAVALAAVERTALNDFATWRTIEARVAELLPRRVARAPARGAGASPAPAPQAARLVQ